MKHQVVDIYQDDGRDDGCYDAKGDRQAAFILEDLLQVDLILRLDERINLIVVLKVFDIGLT